MNRAQTEGLKQRPTSKNTAEPPSTEATQSNSSSLWESIIAEDKKWTSALSICAHEESPLAKFRPVMKALEISFHGLLWLGGTVVAFFMTHRVQDIEVLVNLFNLLILDLVVVGLTKLVFRRARPTDNRMDMFATVSVDLFSFPSGHATRAAMVGSLLVHRVVGKRLAPLVVALCGGVGVSRVMLGRHHVLDVVCGLSIGVGEYLLYLPFWLPFHLIEEWLHEVLSHIHL
ncbi:polyisoprenoid diphosphate/phosphate phosphohydrolase PLPP6-like [Babylonia areolata]|uniref:polyisoprenoid diphosphate/phosphate phosphohydrolase PLPP6-like n=1 Tax=Babylonia areolata TaxID=304850 RepID=UPI003FD687EF